MSGAKKKLDRRAAQAELGLSEREKQELQRQKAQRRNNIIAIVGGVIAVLLVVALLVWNSGFIPRHTTAVKFTATDAAAKDLTLTKADMNYYYYLAMNDLYSQEQQLASIYEQSGLEYTPSFDPSGNLKKQYVDEEQTMSFHDYFVQQAMTRATQTIAMSNAAKSAGYTLSEEAQAGLDSALADLDAQVSQYGMGSRDNYLRAVYGRTTNEKVYLKNLERSVWASEYYTAKTDEMGEYTDADLESYYAEHVDELDSYDYDYVYFDGTVQPAVDGEDASAAPSPTDEEKAAALSQAKQDAESLLSAIKANATAPAEGEEAQTKDFATLASDFGAQANTQTGNAGSTFAGAPFADWLKDSARTQGDADVFEVENSGYYVVQFQGRHRSDIPSSANVRHILIKTSHDDDPETADVDESQVPFTDEEVTAAHAEAERILQEFTSGEQTGERFGELAEQYSGDTRNEDGTLYTAGGLYEDVTPTTNFVQEFLDWIFVSDRKAGDTGIVKTTYGYHIMFADAVDEAKWKADSRSAMKSEEEQSFLEDIQAGYVASVDKWTTPALKAAQESEEPSPSPEA